MSTLLGIFRSNDEEEAQPAKTPKRRVDEYTLRLTSQQWRILEALEEGAELTTSKYSTFSTLVWNGIHEWHSRNTTISLTKRKLISWSEGEPQPYHLTDEGRHALRIRRENKQGSGLI